MLCLCALTLTLCGVWISAHTVGALDAARLSFWNISAAAYNTKPTLEHLDKASSVWANASQKQADAADALIRDLRVISWHLDRSFLKLDTVLDTSNDQLKHVGPLLDSVKTATDAVPDTLSHVNGAADASRGTIEALGRDADDIHAKLTDKRTDELIEHFRGMSASGDSLLADAAYKGHQLLHPDKVKLTFWTGANATVKWIHANVIPPLF